MSRSRNRRRSTKGMSQLIPLPLTNSRGTRHYGMATPHECNNHVRSSAWDNLLQGPSVDEENSTCDSAWSWQYMHNRSILIRHSEIPCITMLGLSSTLVWFLPKLNRNIYAPWVVSGVQIGGLSKIRELVLPKVFISPINGERAYLAIKLTLFYLKDVEYTRYPNIITLQSHCRKYILTRRLALFRVCMPTYTTVVSLQAHIVGVLARKRYNEMKLISIHKYTAFPRLGFETVDGCDCLLLDPSRDLSILPHILAMVFGPKHGYSPQLLVSSLNTWLISRKFNSKNLYCIEYDKFYNFYIGNDCHLEEGEPSLKHGHSLVLLCVVRVQPRQISIIHYVTNEYTQDLSDLVEDQHLANLRNLSFVEPPKRINTWSHDNEQSMIKDSPEFRDDDVVLCHGVEMYRSQKQEMRRKRRQQQKQDLANGLKPKRDRVPKRLQGLTRQAYYEVLKREADDAEEHYLANGNKTLPQNVREYLSSPRGSYAWNQAHNFAINRRDLAEQHLAVINKYLRTLGLKFDLPINDNLVKILREKRDRANALQQAQKQAQRREDWEEARQQATMSTKALNKISRKQESVNLVDDFGRENINKNLHNPNAWMNEEDDDDSFLEQPLIF